MRCPARVSPSQSRRHIYSWTDFKAKVGAAPDADGLIRICRAEYAADDLFHTQNVGEAGIGRSLTLGACKKVADFDDLQVVESQLMAGRFDESTIRLMRGTGQDLLESVGVVWSA